MSQPKSSKFKPVKHTTPNLNVRKHAPTGLASFSTPGFNQSKPTQASAASLSNLETVDLSVDDHSSTVSAFAPVKRTSSDPSIDITAAQPSKRVKKDEVSNKENSFMRSSVAKGKGRAVSVLHSPPSARSYVGSYSSVDPISRRRNSPKKGGPSVLRSSPQEAAKPTESSSFQKSLTVVGESSPNFWLSSDKLLPVSQDGTRFDVVKAAASSDLSSMDVAKLKRLLTADLEARNKAMESFQLYLDGSLDHDPFILEGLNRLLDARITAIRTALEDHRNGIVISPTRPSDGGGYSSLLLQIPSATGSSTTTQNEWHFSSLAQSAEAGPSWNTSNSYSKTPSTDSGARLPIQRAVTVDADADLTLPDSDDIYWDDKDPLPQEIFDISPDRAEPSPAIAGPSSSSGRSHNHATVDSAPSIHRTAIMRVLNQVFKLSSFRTNQYAAIEATMSGKDVFVLMPTGGGKSLCFQLPAVCTGGSTRGVTVVLSPLKALMHDQVASLRERGIDVEVWNSEMSQDESSGVAQRLLSREKPSLCYISPEKLQQSNRLGDILERLYASGEIARFVIDEAHCISSWGRDFREAYADLSILRQKYPKVPIMALTASATPVAIDDIIKQLHIQGCLILRQSFNRPNLRYTIREKKKSVITDIANWVKEHHKNESGIVYCLSRNECEDVARILRETHGLHSTHFHANLNTEQKNAALREWKAGRCHIIVATIAFGMGIDKPDVRFVVHQTFPKSLEGYYQETGRAGRDGQEADCLLYFTGHDRIRYESMIKNPRDRKQLLPFDAQKRSLDEIQKVAEFCSNEADCRRVQLLHHYGEQFDPVQCNGFCDNCVNSGIGAEEDMTKNAQDVIHLVRELSANNQRITERECLLVYKGSMSKGVTMKRYDENQFYGKGRDLPKGTPERVFARLISLGGLATYNIANSSGYHNTYLGVGDRANSYLNGSKKFMLVVKPAKAGQSNTERRKKAAPKALTSKRGVRKRGARSQISSAVDDDEIEWAALYADDEVDVADPIASYQGEDNIGLDSSSSDPSDKIVVPTDPFSLLFNLLKTCREKLANENQHPYPENVIDDEGLQLLCLHRPKDFPSFSRVLRDCSFEESVVQLKWKLYGQRFLQVILDFDIEYEDNPPKNAARCAEKPLNPKDLRSRYAYSDSTDALSKARR